MNDTNKHNGIGGDFGELTKGEGLVTFVKPRKLAAEEKVPGPKVCVTQPYCIKDPTQFLADKGFPPLDTIV